MLRKSYTIIYNKHTAIIYIIASLQTEILFKLANECILTCILYPD